MDDAEIRLNQARQQWEAAVEAILRADGIAAIRQADAKAHEAWREINAAMAGLIQAKLQTIGR